MKVVNHHTAQFDNIPPGSEGEVNPKNPTVEAWLRAGLLCEVQEVVEVSSEPSDQDLFEAIDSATEDDIEDLKTLRQTKGLSRRLKLAATKRLKELGA